MASSADEDEPALSLAKYLSLAADIQLCCRHLRGVQGAQKLERKIGTEVKFLTTLGRRDVSTQTAHLQSSNLSHYAAIVHAATHLPGVTHVLQPFSCPDRADSLLVDVVAAGGHAWVKVVARKGQALHLVWAGQGQFGERDMVQQIKEYQLCAAHHPVSFRPPRAHLTFYNTLTQPMAATLRDMGVRVWGYAVPVHPTVVRQLSSVSCGEDSDDEEEEEDYADEWSCHKNDTKNDLDDFNDEDCRKGSGEGFVSENCIAVRCKLPLAQSLDGDLAVDCEPDMNAEDKKFTFRDNSEDGRDVELGSAVRLRHKAQSGLSFRERLPMDPVSDAGISPDEPGRRCDVIERGQVTEPLVAGIQSQAFWLCSDRDGQAPQCNLLRGGAGDTSPVPGDNVGRDSSVIGTSPRNNAITVDTSNALSVSIRQPLCHQPPSARHLGGTCSRSDHRLAHDVIGVRPLATSPDGDVREVRSSSWRVSTRLMPCLSCLLSHPPAYTDFEDKVSGDEADLGAEVKKVNLDITTLITLVSSICHGDGCRFRFPDKVLDQQAAEEREHPVLPDLQKFLEGKRLLVCRTALSDFQSILGLLGGPQERQRADELLDTVEIVDDQVSSRTEHLQPKGKVKDRSKVIFGTGDALQAVTVTANLGFIRAAKNQGVSFAVHLHPARALTEQKKISATPL